MATYRPGQVAARQRKGYLWLEVVLAALLISLVAYGARAADEGDLVFWPDPFFESVMCFSDDPRAVPPTARAQGLFLLVEEGKTESRPMTAAEFEVWRATTPPPGPREEM